MTWTRKELMDQATDGMKKSYWKTVFTSFLLFILTWGLSISAGLDSVENIPKVINDLTEQEFRNGATFNTEVIAVILVLTSGVLLLATVIKIAISILLKNPLEVGATKLYTRALHKTEEVRVSDLLFVLDSDYLNVVAVQFMCDVRIAVGYVLLIIPGVIMSYQYRMVPYLLAESPSMKTKEALAMSRKMMKGHKMRAVLLDLSFIPWRILGIITLGTLSVFYVWPKKRLVDTALYLKLREENDINPEIA